MLDSSCSETPKTKKKTAQNRPVQRFWPDSIASGAAQPPPGELAMSEGTGRPGRACGDSAGRGRPRARGAGRPSGPASSGRGSRCVPRPLLPLRREGGGTRARRSVPVREAPTGLDDMRGRHGPHPRPAGALLRARPASGHGGHRPFSPPARAPFAVGSLPPSSGFRSPPGTRPLSPRHGPPPPPALLIPPRPSCPGPRPLVARVLVELGISALTPKTVSER